MRLDELELNKYYIWSKPPRRIFRIIRMDENYIYYHYVGEQPFEEYGLYKSHKRSDDIIICPKILKIIKCLI